MKDYHVPHHFISPYVSSYETIELIAVFNLMPKAQSKQLSFPILPENQLIDTFSSLQIDASSALKQSNSMNTKELYQQIILRLLDCTFNDIFNSESISSTDFTYPELHEHSTAYSPFLITL